MAMIETSPGWASLSARLEERFVAPARASSRLSRSRFVALLVLVLAIHAAILGWFLYRDSKEPIDRAETVETPVEVVVEPPPEKPKPPPPEAQKPPPPPDPATEKPATSAPRALKADAADAKTTAQKTEGLKTQAAPRDGQAAPTEATARPDKPETAPASTPVDAKLQDDKRDAEALDKATPDPSQKPDAATKVAPKTDEAAKADAARQQSGVTAAPSYNFAAAGAMAQFPEGQEDNRYLAVVYGMVMSKNRYIGSAAARRGVRGMVSVSFVVDPFGNVRFQSVVESSGQADLDALAMTAVRTAAPFPPPPGSGSQELIARMGFGLGTGSSNTPSR